MGTPSKRTKSNAYITGTAQDRTTASAEVEAEAGAGVEEYFPKPQPEHRALHRTASSLHIDRASVITEAKRAEKRHAKETNHQAAVCQTKPRLFALMNERARAQAQAPPPRNRGKRENRHSNETAKDEFGGWDEHRTALSASIDHAPIPLFHHAKTPTYWTRQPRRTAKPKHLTERRCFQCAIRSTWEGRNRTRRASRPARLKIYLDILGIYSTSSHQTHNHRQE